MVQNPNKECSPTPLRAPTETAARINRVVEDCLRRRLAGEDLSDDAVLAAYPELQPGLAGELHKLALIQEADQAAQLEEPASGTAAGNRKSTSSHEPSAMPPADSFAGYELLREIHRGGQGVVYRARQKATYREVALKVMREGPFNSFQDQARFDREVRILAQLRHPNIVAIHDRGVTGDHHFFVMDYIAGRPLDVYLAESKLTVEQKLKLFVKICDAADCAHLRGVVHRDLKPGNILVDERGEPHILDFGLAKDSANAGADHTVTEPGQFLGSLPWCSPEQVRGRPEAVDIRTDVYSLGLLLYEALTGNRPYDLRGSVRDIMNTILDVDPARPSSRSRGVDRDLEAIVLKCLAKSPSDRYASAGALAEDIHRHQAGQPVLARLPTTTYYVRKLITRHKLSFSLLLLLFLSLSGSVVTLAVLRHRAIDAERKAEAQRAEAVQSADAVRAVNSFLIDEMLAASDPSVSRGKPITVETVLARAAGRIDESLKNQPLVEASVRETLARTYFSMALFDKAEPHVRRAVALRQSIVPVDHEESIAASLLLSDILIQLGRFDEAARILADVRPLSHRALGADHVSSLSASFQEAMIAWHEGDLPRSNRIHGEVLARRRRILGDHHPDTLRSVNEWFETSGLYGKNDAASESVLRMAIDVSRRILGADHPQTLRAMANLGMCLTEQRRLEEGEALLAPAVEGLRNVLGDAHAETIVARLRLAVLRKEQDRCHEAETLASQASRDAKRAFGRTHPVYFSALCVLGSVSMRRGDYSAGVRISREALACSIERYGPQHIFIGEAESYLANAEAQFGQLVEAEKRLRSAIPVLRQGAAPGNAQMGWVIRLYLKVLAARGGTEEARPLAVELLELRRNATLKSPNDAYLLNCYARELLTVYPEDLRDPVRALETARKAYNLSTDQYHYNRFTLAQALRANGFLPEALDMYRLALKHAPLEQSTERAMYERTLSAVLEDSGDSMGAERVYRDSLDKRIAALPTGHVDVGHASAELGRYLLLHGRMEEAESHLSKALQIRNTAWGENDWRTLDSRLHLAICLSVTGRAAEAEKMLGEVVSALSKLDMAPCILTERAKAALDRIRQGADPRSALDLSDRFDACW